MVFRIVHTFHSLVGTSWFSAKNLTFLYFGRRARPRWRSVKRYVEMELANIGKKRRVEKSESNHEANYDCDQETVTIPKSTGVSCDEIRMPGIRIRPASESNELAPQYRDDLQFVMPSCHSAFVSGHHGNNPSNLKSFLAKWAVDNHITLSSLSSLVKGLKRECCSTCSDSLPFNGRSLLKTDRDVSLKIQNRAGGQYIHIGVENGIHHHIASTTDESN